MTVATAVADPNPACTAVDSGSGLLSAPRRLAEQSKDAEGRSYSSPISLPPAANAIGARSDIGIRAPKKHALSFPLSESRRCLCHIPPAPSESSLDRPLLAPPAHTRSSWSRTQSGGATLASYLALDAPSAPHQPLGVWACGRRSADMSPVEGISTLCILCLWRVSVRPLGRQCSPGLTRTGRIVRDDWSKERFKTPPRLRSTHSIHEHAG